MRLEWAHWSEVPADAWWWRWFTPRELASRGDGSLRIDPDALDRLSWVRRDLDRPVVILSAYRDPLHNARVGGAPSSRHKEGDAFDLALRGQGAARLLALCRRAGFRGFGFYGGFLHVDRGPERRWLGKGGMERWSGLVPWLERQ